MIRCGGALGAAFMLLTACVDRGITPVFSQGGVAAPDPGVTQYPNANPLDNFKIAAQQAQNNPSATTNEHFMRSGFALIYIRCNEYFDQKGSDQASANLLRDSIAPLVAVMTGVLALHTYKITANADHDISLLTLATTTAVSGLDIYSKHFLFGAESIESVRKLVNEELNTHAAAALTLEPDTIEEASLQIADDQRICLPSHILASTRAAIANGKFAPSISGTGGAISTDLLTQLGSDLSLTPPTITETQAGLLFATTMGLVRDPAERKFVRLQLSMLPEVANPISDDGSGNYAIKSDFEFAKLKQAFDAAPVATKTYFLSQSKRIMASAVQSAKADKAAIQNGGGMASFLAARGDPDTNLRAFGSSPAAEYILPSTYSKALRRVRVTAR